LYRAEEPGRKARSKTRRTGRIALATIGPDLAARLRERQRALRTRLERRDALIEIVRAVNATLEPGKIAEIAVDHAAGWIPASCWAVVVGDPSGQLSVLADRGFQPDLGPAVYSVAQLVMDTGHAFVSADLARDTRVAYGGAAAVVAFPLRCRGDRLGALVGLDRTPASAEPRLGSSVLSAVNVLLEPVSAALNSALLLKRTEALSVTDDLTHLYNSRYLGQVLRRETKRASRSGRPLSLLFLDLDGFKSVNDSHGHLCGSRALVEAADLIRRSARETDIVARFGGDEFSLVLPETGHDGALAVGERIRERIAAHAFLAGEGLNIHLTVSVGVATLPDAATSADELLRAADSAMYQVKARGKDGIQAATPPADK
jgi:diguanylate cyclase (GGDEF)-like protein